MKQRLQLLLPGAANLKAKKEKLIAAQEAKDNSKAQAAEYKEGGKEAKAEENFGYRFIQIDRSVGPVSVIFENENFKKANSIWL